MLASLDRLFRRGARREERSVAASPPARDGAEPTGLAPAQPGDVETFLVAARIAATQGHAPWVLRNQAQLDILERAVAFTVHRKCWLQRTEDGIQHWQGRLLALRHGDAPPLGLLLACRPDDEAAWQLRFFCIVASWRGNGHATRLLRAARRTLNGVPLHTRLPLACHTAVRSLEAAGFQRMHVDATKIASFEAPAQWD